MKTAGLSPRWLFVTAIVFLAGVFLHLPVTDFCDWLAREYGFTAYDDAVRLGAMTLGTGAFLAVWLWPDRHRVPIGIAVTGLLALAVIAHKVIVVNAIESIHYPQYALIAVLLARSGFGLEPAWLGATLLGAVDEGYQAVALPRGAPDYFDWNDVLLNGIGAAFGALIVVMTGFAVMQNGRVPSMARWGGVALAIAFALRGEPTGLVAVSRSDTGRTSVSPDVRVRIDGGIGDRVRSGGRGRGTSQTEALRRASVMRVRPRSPTRYRSSGRLAVRVRLHRTGRRSDRAFLARPRPGGTGATLRAL